MARRKKEQPSENQSENHVEHKEAVRHRLLVYYNLGKRYRGPGIFLFLIGIVFFLPVIISDLESTLVKKEALALVGTVLILAGLGFWLFSQLARQRAYVLCRPDLLEIRTPFYRTFVSYLRIKQVQSAQVSQMFERDALKGMGRPLMIPLLSMTAVEMLITSWPAPKKRLQRMLSQFLFSPRAEAWVFIVPNYSLLIREIENAAQTKAAEEASSDYKDPFERLRYYN